MTSTLSPDAIGALASNPALPLYTAQAHAWGVVALVLAGMCLLLTVAAALAAWHTRRSEWLLLLIPTVLFFALALSLGLPRVISPRSFALHELACESTYTCNTPGAG